MCWIDLYQIEFYGNDHTPHDINITLQTNRTERPNFTNGSRPSNHDHLRHLSLPADKITAEMTNQFLQTGIRTFDWQQLFSCLWWWLPLRLSKRQSPLPTIVLIRTKLTHTIKLHYYILLYYNLVAFACREWTSDIKFVSSLGANVQILNKKVCATLWKNQCIDVSGS